MQAEKNNTSSPQNEQLNITGPAETIAAAILKELETDGHSIIELCPLPHITPRQALYLGMMACNYLLTGSPAPETFDAADLEMAIPLLQQMAATIEEARRCGLYIFW